MTLISRSFCRHHTWLLLDGLFFFVLFFCDLVFRWHCIEILSSSGQVTFEILPPFLPIVTLVADTCHSNQALLAAVCVWWSWHSLNPSSCHCSGSALKILPTPEA